MNDNNLQYEHGYALLIGIRYGHWGKTLEGTLKDVEALYQHFTNPQTAAYIPENVIALTEEKATAQGILDALNELAAKVRKDPEASVIIHYSGHGYSTGTKDFLVPYDFDIDLWRASKEINEETIVSSSQFSSKIAAIKAKKSLIILDCCHAENIPVERGIDDNNSRFLDNFVGELENTLDQVPDTRGLSDEVAKGTGRVILTSCKTDETSLDIRTNGLFTAVLLDCLNGSKNLIKDGWVRLIDMIHFIPREVTRRADPHPQHPKFKSMTDIGGEEFIICAYNISSTRELDAPITNIPNEPTTNMPANYQHIRNLIAQGKLEKAIAEAMTAANQSKDNDLITEVNSFSERHSTNERKQRLGVLSSDKYREERNQIVFALLEMINVLEKPASKVDTSQRNTETGDGNIMIQGVSGSQINIGGTSQAKTPNHSQNTNTAELQAFKGKLLKTLDDKGFQGTPDIFEEIGSCAYDYDKGTLANLRNQAMQPLTGLAPGNFLVSVKFFIGSIGV